ELIDETTATLEDTPVDELPDSDSVTVTDPGTYFWVVTYTPPASEGQSPDNNEAVSDCSTESFTISEDPGNTVLPVAPAVVQAVCNEQNMPTTPSVTLPEDTDDITYTKEGDEVPGGTVEVTAEL